MGKIEVDGGAGPVQAALGGEALGDHALGETPLRQHGLQVASRGAAVEAGASGGPEHVIVAAGFDAQAAQFRHYVR